MRKQFVKIMSLILIIGVLVTLPGFMVGVSAINRSIISSNRKDKTFVDEEYNDDFYLNGTEIIDVENGIVQSSYIDLEMMYERIKNEIGQNNDKEENKELTVPNRTGVLPNTSTYF